jgi:hypothetical protein
MRQHPVHVAQEPRARERTEQDHHHRRESHSPSLPRRTQRREPPRPGTSPTNLPLPHAASVATLSCGFGAALEGLSVSR